MCTCSCASSVLCFASLEEFFKPSLEEAKRFFSKKPSDLRSKSFSNLRTCGPSEPSCCAPLTCHYVFFFASQPCSAQRGAKRACLLLFTKGREAGLFFQFLVGLKRRCLLFEKKRLAAPTFVALRKNLLRNQLRENRRGLFDLKSRVISR